MALGVGVGPTARRRNELGLLTVALVVVAFASLLPSLALTGKLPAHELELLLGLIVIGAVVQVANRRLAPEGDPVLMPVALILNGLGYVMIDRVASSDPNQYHREPVQQLVWTVIGVGVYIAVLALVRRSRDLDRYRYMMLAAAFALLVMPLVPKIGENINGARLWVHAGSLEFQPIEISKLLLVFFFASYFIEKRELLTLRTRRVGNHLLPDLRAFGPIAVAAVMSLLIILGEHDIGFSLLLFIIFLSMLWVTTGRWTYLAIGLVLFALGTFVASHVLSQLSERISIWLNPWSTPGGAGYQPIQGELAFGRGGLFGTGLGMGLASNPSVLPDATSDFVFSIFGEELGLFGSVALVVAYLLMVGSGIRAALRARSEFAKLAAMGLAVLLGFQAFLIMAGIIRLLPLTGVTLPFVSYGGSSLVANYALLAILMRISDEGNQLPSGTSPASSRSANDAVIGAGRR